MAVTAVGGAGGSRAQGAGAARPLLEGAGGVIALGIVLSLALSWPRALTVWRDNTFFDTDDAMRLVQVRAWLDGQGWFDLVAHRLDPPAGLLMHWSRVVDVPVAALVRVFGLFADADGSERAARIAFPLLMQAALMAVTVGLGRLLAGRRAAVPAMVLTVLSGFTFEQFPPGRIDHHAPQIVLLVTTTLALLSSLSPGRAWHGVLAALSLSLSLAISLENLPFLAVLVAVLPLAWVGEPARARAAMGWFAGGLAVFGPALFAATVPPDRTGVPAVDAFSILHLSGMAAGSAALALLAGPGGRLPGVTARLAAVAVAGAFVAGSVALLFPGALHGPYAGMDPVLQRLWLAHVTEAQPLFAAAALRPATLTTLGGPLAFGVAGLALLTWRTRGLARLRWAALLALAVVGLAGTAWEIRVASSVQPLALMGGVGVVAGGLHRVRGRLAALAGPAALLGLLPFSTLAWAFVPAGEGDRAAAEALLGGQACRQAAALAPLAALPPGLVFAPVDDGAHLLVATAHGVIAAPYHRNGAGNRRVIDGLLASPTAAEAIVRQAGARYVAVCPGEVEITVLAAEAPEGLGAALVRGAPPAWLAPVDVGLSPYRVFAVRPQS